MKNLYKILMLILISILFTNQIFAEDISYLETQDDIDEYIVQNAYGYKIHSFTYLSATAQAKVEVEGTIEKDISGVILSSNLSIFSSKYSSINVTSFSTNVVKNSETNYGNYVQVSYTVYATINGHRISQSDYINIY